MKTYINGNYFVQNDPWTGSKLKRTLRVGEDFIPSFPDSIDLKITNSCSNACPFCHESSIPGGASFDLERTKILLSQLPRVGIELAIGGGNVFDIPDQTCKLIKWAEQYGFLPRVTINWKDVVGKGELPWDSHVPIGVSMNHYVENPKVDARNVVWHVIVGILPVEDLMAMFNDPNSYRRILVLGFKQFGRAKNMEIKNLEEWKEAIRRLIWQSRNVMGSKKVTLGFDNLALEQLELKDCLTSDEWSLTYFGDEFTSSMYVDAVEETYAPTSRSLERVKWTDMGILEYFKNEYVHSY